MDISGVLLGEIDRAVSDGRFATLYAVAKAAGIKPELVYKFVQERGDLRLSSAAKLCEALGLVLVPAGGSAPVPKARKASKARKSGAGRAKNKRG